MSIYEKHIFICINQREPNHPKKCCGSLGVELRKEFVENLIKYNLQTKVRANKSGCLDGCVFGPMVVIYPEAIWYQNVQIKDVDEIVRKTILKNEIIERLVYKR